MCESKIVRKVSFTGSTPVAKLLYGMSASTLKKYVYLSTPFRLTPDVCLGTLRVSIEAGGNAPFIVFGDADIEKAVEGKSGWMTMRLRVI